MIARNEGVREWCPLSLTLIYTRECVGNIVRQWQNKFRNQFRINQNILHDILLSDEQTVIPKTGMTSVGHWKVHLQSNATVSGYPGICRYLCSTANVFDVTIKETFRPHLI
jgi:hypothetical protein